MKVNELLEQEKGNYTEYEVYCYTDKSRRLHTDFIKSVDISGDETVLDWWLMGEDDYNHTILANYGEYFTDMFERDDKILVIVVKEDE